jgi:hypothetical protein
LYLRVEWNKELKEKYKRQTDRQRERRLSWAKVRKKSFNKGRA